MLPLRHYQAEVAVSHLLYKEYSLPDLFSGARSFTSSLGMSISLKKPLNVSLKGVGRERGKKEKGKEGGEGGGERGRRREGGGRRAGEGKRRKGRREEGKGRGEDRRGEERRGENFRPIILKT